MFVYKKFGLYFKMGSFS